MISVLDGAKNKVILRVKIGIFLRCCKIAYIKSAFLAGGGSAGGELIIFFHEFIFFAHESHEFSCKRAQSSLLELPSAAENVKKSTRIWCFAF